MKQEYRKKWIVLPQTLPGVLRRCPKCGRKAEFENSGTFRVNANGRLLDVWLVYRCTVCETSLNMTVYERVEADTLEQGEYKGFLNNDRTLAAAYGSSRSLFAKNRAQMVEHWDKYTVRETDTTVPCRQEQWSEVEVWLGGYLKPRMDALFARQLGVSRSQIKGLCGAGLGCVMEGKADAGARVKNGQVFYISRECRAGRKLLAVGDAGCFYDGHAIY